MSRETHVRFWERAAVKARRATRPFVFSEGRLRRVLAEYTAYFNQWRPHRSIGQRAPCAAALTTPGGQGGTVVATPVLGGLHHIYQIAA
jgi:putative transposase